MKKKIVLFFLLINAFTSVFAQENDINANDARPSFASNSGAAKFQFMGETVGMFTLGFADSKQIIIPADAVSPKGVYDNLNDGMNGYYTKMDFRVLYNPFPFIDIFVKFYARYRPGSPYIPLQLETADKDDFSLSLDSAWGRIDAIAGLGLELPLSVFIKAGKFDSAPESFQNVTRFGTESVMEKIRTKNTYALQLEASIPLSFAESLSVTGATSLKFNEGITPLYDTDGSVASHGDPGLEEKYDIPVFASISLKKIETPAGSISAEVVYAYNAEGIFSGHNFGGDARMEIQAIPGVLSFPIGLGIALLEKNIDPLARSAVDRTNKNAVNDNLNDYYSVSFRRSLSAGLGIGARFSMDETLSSELNIGYTFTQAAHYYRETININSLSVDLSALINNRFIVGGGIFLGTLMDTEWVTKEGVPPSRETGYLHTFTMPENMGFEFYAGLKFTGARLVLGFNLNKGISMNHSIEALKDSQIIYKQPDTNQKDDLFQRGGFFTKLIISW